MFSANNIKQEDDRKKIDDSFNFKLCQSKVDDGLISKDNQAHFNCMDDNEKNILFYQAFEESEKDYTSSVRTFEETMGGADLKDNLNPKNSQVRLKFLEKLNDMKYCTENILDKIKDNFLIYINNQKTHLNNTLNSIENLFNLEANSPQCEAEKNNQIDVKMTLFSTELGGLLSDLQKFK